MDVPKASLASLAMFLAVAVASTKACLFPSFMQNSTDRDWRSGVRNQFTQFTVQVVVHGHTMDVISSDSSIPSYQRFCLMTKPDDKFLVLHENTGQRENRYTCMKFVRRSHNVVQFRAAPLSDSMDEDLCEDDRMVLDDWILVDKTHIVEDRKMCPLEGGFSTVIYDRVKGQAICDSYQGHTRMESECVKGEGLLFHFRDVKCVPEHVYMYSKQRTLCLADWEEGPYTFMLIKHDRDDYVWMFRYPTIRPGHSGDSFVAFLLNDLVAETGAQFTHTNNFVRLSCARDQPVLATSLCVDDYEICAYRRDLCSEDEERSMALICPRSCGVCNASRPVVCNFPAHLQGQWRDMGHSGTVSLSVNTSSLTVHGHMDEKFHCIQWDPTPSNPEGFMEKMLVTDYQNGCKPRYSCARFLQRGTNTLFFGISENHGWPFTDSAFEALTCGSRFSYEQDITLYPNPFRSRHTKLLFSGGNHSPVNCGLPSDMHTFSVQLKDGTRCKSTLTEDAEGTSLLLTVSECPDNRFLQDAAFTCMESSTMLPTTELLIVTKTSSSASPNQSQSHCWVFPKRPRSKFYLVDSARCNEDTNRKIRKGRLNPLGVFTKLRRQPLVQGSTPDDMRSQNASTTLTPGKGNGDVENDVTVDYRKVLNNTDSKNTTRDTEGGRETNAAPFVVVGALLLFAAFQIPCCCRSS